MLSPETIEFIIAHRNEDARTLALQAKRYPSIDMREAVAQIEGWQQAREKLPAWAATAGIIYPPKISMEQCSSEQTAKYKAALVAGKVFADMTGGFGIDFSYICRGFEKAVDLVGRFIKNFTKYTGNEAGKALVAAGPKP